MKGWVLICLVLVWVVLLLHPLLPFLGQVLLVVGLIVAFITPMVFISDPSARASPDAAYHFGVIGEYQLAGVVLGVFVATGYVVCLKWGVRERGEFGRDSLMVPTSWEALRRTLGNRAFIIFLVANTANWYVFGLLPTIIPIYGQFVLNIPLGQSLLLGLLLGFGLYFGGGFCECVEVCGEAVAGLA